MPTFYRITFNGNTFRGGFSNRKKAEAEAEDLQRGMLKNRDDKEYFEVDVDRAAMREWDHHYDVFKRGQPQTIEYIYGVKD